MGGGVPPRPRPQDPRLRRPPPPPPGWNRPPLQIPRSPGRPTHRAWLIALVLVATVSAAAWYFLIRESAPSSAFVRAFERYSAAVDHLREDAAQVTRFLDLPEYQDQALFEIEVMRKQEVAFKRLARKENGEEEKRIAEEAAAAARRGWYSAGVAREAIINRRLSTANNANAEVGNTVAQLKTLVDQWKALSS